MIILNIKGINNDILILQKSSILFSYDNFPKQI